MLLVLVFAGQIAAAPAAPGWKIFRQPDGSVFRGRIMGDEFRSWMETQDGYTIAENQSTGFWEYAQYDAAANRMTPSGTVVSPGSAPPPSLQKHLSPQINIEKYERFKALLKNHYQRRLSHQMRAPSHDGQRLWTPTPVSGDQNLLVILVNFADRDLITKAQDWYDAVFATGTDAKSVRQFYRDNSFGTLDIVPISHSQSENPEGILTVSIDQPHPDCGSSCTLNTEKTWINPALKAAEAYIDFNALDLSGNGTITTDEAVIYFIAAGYEASGSSKRPSIWGMSLNGFGVYAGNKRLSDWARNGELSDDGTLHSIGIMTHELGHQMVGLPDLYDITGTNNGLGIFSLMSSGSWGKSYGENAGDTPVALDAWSREYLGWTSPATPTTDGETLSLDSALSTGSAAVKLINTQSSSTEYFLVENRYPSSWDNGLTYWMGSSWQGGVLILHIDNTVGNLASNSINAYMPGKHQGVLAVHADNSPAGSLGSITSLFSASNNDSFTPDTTPSSNYYDKTASGIGITKISSSGTTMTAQFQTNVVIAPADVLITGFSMDVTGVLAIGESFTMTATASGGAEQGLYYLFGYKPDYGTTGYESAKWVMLQNWSTANTCTHSFSSAGGYVVTVNVADSASPSGITPTMGGVVSVGQASQTLLTGFALNITEIPATGDWVSFSATATAESGAPVFYRFGYKYGYGTDAYTTAKWNMIQDWSTSSTCNFPFSTAGSYIITVDTSLSAAAPSGIAPLMGGSLTIDAGTSRILKAQIPYQIALQDSRTGAPR